MLLTCNTQKIAVHQQAMSALYAMKNYFQYDAVLLSKFNEGIESFVRIIKKELTNGFPLYIEGMPEGGRSGHAWGA